MEALAKGPGLTLIPAHRPYQWVGFPPEKADHLQ